MPARTGNTTYIPGKGTTKRGPSGKAKTFVGKGPAPAGTEKVAAPTLAQATAHPAPSPAGERARALARTQHMRGVLRATGVGRQTKPARSTGVKAEIKAPPAKLAKIQQAVRANVKEFKAEQAPTVKVVAHTRSVPKPPPLTKYPAVVKRVQRQLAKAKASAQHLVGDLGPEQRRFVRGVSKRTRLNPRTIAAQARAEEGSGSQTEAEQSHNFLNMGPGIKYGSLKEGIQQTAQNYNTNPLYAGVRATRGKGPQAQAAAIAASPWGTGSLIEKTLPEVGLKGKPIPPRLLAKAKALGINTAAPNAGPPPKQVIRKYNAALKTMKAIDSKHFEYVWGGGHGSFTGPYDCSGAISAMIHSVDPKLKAPLVSGSMGQVLQPGPGAITVFYNGEHTFAYIPALHKYWGTSESNPGGGAGFFPKSVGDSEVASGNSAGAYNVGHVPGLGRKEAFQLGATNLGSAQSFPGMTLSSSGTQATINSGAGATVAQPGFSSKPIQLTPRQKFKELKELGVGVSPHPSDKGPSTQTLAELDKKYGAAA